MIRLFLYVLLLSCFTNFQAQEFVFKSYVDQNNISTDDYVRFTVESSERVRLDNLQFQDFSVRQGPFTSSSSQTTIINGKFESKNEYKSTFVLAPKKPGKLVIAAIKVNYNSKEYSTQKIIVNVGKGQKNNSSNSNKNSSNSKLFAKISCSKTNPYIGENILVNYKIYQSSYHIRNLEITDYDLSMSNDFWTELLEPKNKQWKESQEIINGISFRVFTIKKEIISPQKSGKLTIPSFEVSTVINRDFFNRGVPKIIKSNSPVLNVKKLPDNSPKSFNGQVGSNYKMNVKVSKNELEVDQALDFEIKISGNGNLKQLKFPNIDFPKDLEKYPEEIKSKIQLTENGVSGRKKLNQLLIPRFHGDYEIPSFDFCYFDVRSKKYITLNHPRTLIKVTKSENSSNLETTTSGKIKTVDQEDVELMSENIHHIRSKTKLYDFSNPIFGTAFYWSILGSFPLSLIFLILFLNNKDRFLNKEKAHLRKTIKQVQSSFRAIKQDFSNMNQNDFFKEIYKLWNIYLLNKYDIKLSELSRDKIKEILTKSNVPTENVEAMDKILNVCEMSQYSPLSNEDAEKTLEDCENLIKNLEKNVA
ncbi:MAG: BatD family protein [Flavobacteriales bacterium]